MMSGIVLSVLALSLALSPAEAAAKTCRPESDAQEVFYEEGDAEILARLMWCEASGVDSDTERACVAWTVLNRLDSPDFDGGTVSQVVAAPGQFYYFDWAPVEEDLLALASDVLDRWNSEKNGGDGAGRVLPADYFWYSGDGEHNYFRNAYRGGDRWDYSLQSPYGS